MQITTTTLRFTTYGLTTSLILIGLVGGVGIRHAMAVVLGPCQPGFVKQHRHSLAVRLAATARPVASEDGSVLVEWLGHSSFLLTSPAGLHLLTDPNGYHAAASTPDIITVSNQHATHADVGSVPGATRVLWGITPDGAWHDIALTLKDVTLYNIPSYASRTDSEQSPIHNSLFVFHIGGFCIVHLGNLRHPLTPQQLQKIGQPDVAMVPVDGHWTLAYDDVLTVIAQLQPRLVIPMHIDFSQHAELFVQATAGRYAVRRVAGRTLNLSRQSLPATTEIVVFTSP